nr:type IIL restriction-modification enzyme MmeI [Haematobacter missouriensis]
MANALLHRYSPTLFQLDDAARQYRGMTLLELARESLGNSGVNTRGLSRDEVATRALHSTSDFPEILSAVTNKTLRQAYEAYPRTFMLFCRQVLATDFKAMHRVQLGDAPQLLEVGESGEFKRGTLGESKESYKVKTYGRVMGSQEIVNGFHRYCLWIKEDQVDDAMALPPVAAQIAKVREFRLDSTKEPTRRMAERPFEFDQIRIDPSAPSILIPSVTSERRPYLPVEKVGADVISSNLNQVLYDAPDWCVALIASRLHLV